VHRIAGNLRDAHYALQLFYRRAPAKQSPHHTKRLRKVIAGATDRKLSK
jgi:hypothetical protein